MVSLESLIAFLLASLVIVAMPGPGVMFTIGRTLAHGRTAGLLSVAGNAIGTIPLAALVALGVGAIIAQSAILFTVIKLAGSAYLIWLGIQAIRHRNDSAVPTGIVVPKSRIRQLMEGVVVGVTNPKTIAYFVAVLPQFVNVSAGATQMQLFVLGMVFVVLALIFDAAWALVASVARTWLGRSQKRLSAMGAAGGAMMIGLGGVLAFGGNSK